MPDLRLGDCFDVLATLEPESVDALVTDPPYGISFMGQHWDSFGGPGGVGHGKNRVGGREVGGAMKAGDSYDISLRGNRAFQEWCRQWGELCFAAMKPGAHAVVFGGTRTYHRLASGLEDAGFEIRDCLQWLFGSGFPKSLDVSKAIDAMAGAQREVVGRKADRRYLSPATETSGAPMGNISPRLNAPVNYERAGFITAPATVEAAAWQGFGTSLKPAHEPIVLARKPLAGTVAANVLEHGTGALNVGGCRIPIADRDEYERNHSGDRGHDGTRSMEDRGATDLRPGGGSASDARWPANVVIDEEAAAMLDAQSGVLVSGANPTARSSDKFRDVYGDFAGQRDAHPKRGVDVGGAARFFYCAKVSREERNAGLALPSLFSQDGPEANRHPTVKPIALMRWLCRLVTPPGGLVLDPFLGSGTTGIAAGLEGFRFLGIEREEQWMRTAEARIAHWLHTRVEASA